MFLIQGASREPMKGSKSPPRPGSPELAPGHSTVASRVAARQGHLDSRWAWGCGPLVGRASLASSSSLAGWALPDVGSLPVLARPGLALCVPCTWEASVCNGCEHVAGRPCESACRVCARGAHGTWTRCAVTCARAHRPWVSVRCCAQVCSVYMCTVHTRVLHVGMACACAPSGVGLARTWAPCVPRRRPWAW